MYQSTRQACNESINQGHLTKASWGTSVTSVLNCLGGGDFSRNPDLISVTLPTAPQNQALPARGPMKKSALLDISPKCLYLSFWHVSAKQRVAKLKYDPKQILQTEISRRTWLGNLRHRDTWGRKNTEVISHRHVRGRQETSRGTKRSLQTKWAAVENRTDIVERGENTERGRAWEEEGGGEGFLLTGCGVLIRENKNASCRSKNGTNTFYWWVHETQALLLIGGIGRMQLEK